MRLLIIEDDEFLRDTLKRHLSASGFIVDSANDGETGSYIARTNKYDLIILDNLLPIKNAPEVCREIRQEKIKTPILILSVVDDSTEKVNLLELGVDDYMTKPFSFGELIARIKAISRRPYEVEEPTLILDDLTVDIRTQTVERDGEEIYLTRKEYLLLECMVKKAGKVITRSEILEDVWNNDADPFSNTIEAHIRNLRKKIDKGKRKYIQTIPGRGYKLDRNK
jgi:DNA-binding response OmpR family regulator